VENLGVLAGLLQPMPTGATLATGLPGRETLVDEEGAALSPGVWKSSLPAALAQELLCANEGSEWRRTEAPRAREHSAQGEPRATGSTGSCPWITGIVLTFRGASFGIESSQPIRLGMRTLERAETSPDGNEIRGS
jgi:hypothetical protein